MARPRRLRRPRARRPDLAWPGVETGDDDQSRSGDRSRSSSSPAAAAGSVPRSPRSSAVPARSSSPMDPLVTLDGSEQLPTPEETTAGRIVAAGGSARASSVSVTDRDAVREPVRGPGRRARRRSTRWSTSPASPGPRASPRGSEEDWLGVLAVHLDGYLNILGAALPIMAAAGHGRILGVTSGSGWRAGEHRRVRLRQAGRGLAHLAARAARCRPGSWSTPCHRSPRPGWSPPRSGAIRASGRGSGSSTTGGLSLASMPTPEQLGPIGCAPRGRARSRGAAVR